MNTSLLVKRGLCRFVTTAFLLWPFLVLAGPEPSVDGSKEAPPIEKSWCEAPAPFEIRVGLPGWLASTSGNSGVRGIVDTVDVNFGQALNHLTHVPIVLGAEARYQRWEFFGDGQYLQLGASAALPGILFTDANIHLKSGLVEAFVGYRLINCDKAALSFFVGARYNYMGLHISILDNGDPRLPRLRELVGLGTKLDAEGSTSWVDPVIGARGKIKIWKATSLYVEGDIGGFDANGDSAFEIHRQGGTLVRTSVDSSDWSYQVQGGLEFQITRSIWSQIGWRYLKYDYRDGGFSNQTQLNGPFLQTGMNF